MTVYILVKISADRDSHIVGTFSAKEKARQIADDLYGLDEWEEKFNGEMWQLGLEFIEIIKTVVDERLK